MTYFPNPVFKLILSYCDTRFKEHKEEMWYVLYQLLETEQVCYRCGGVWTKEKGQFALQLRYDLYRENNFINKSCECSCKACQCSLWECRGRCYRQNEYEEGEVDYDNVVWDTYDSDISSITDSDSD